LWKGVVSEDGVDAIEPNELLQRKALMLKECGVVLVALSKNNPEDVAPALRDARMLLHEDDFAAMRVNWDAKSLNLSDVARELNVGVDSFVFVDDNPGNRAEMRASLPEVAVTPFPPDLSLYFHSAAVTDEDRMRTAHYKAESLRREEASRLSLDDYLRSLDIKNEIHLITEEEFARVAQLAQKTNQFNVCTNRWTEDDVRAFVADSRHLIFTLHSSDRFGDLGLVAFVHATTEGDAAEIVDWVMSCRAMNRRIEFSMEDEVERALASRGVKEISATWKRTAKNNPVENLFDSFGFELVESTPELRRYERLI
jgi:FkbH-like protein